MNPPAGTWAYLPFLLVWALPVLALQWLIGARYLWRERGRWPWIVAALGAYFTVADAIAIASGTWHFNAAALVGLYVGPVPVEEVLFYLLTAAMVVQGFVVAWGVWGERYEVIARWRQRRLVAVGFARRWSAGAQEPPAGEESLRETTGDTRGRDVSPPGPRPPTSQSAQPATRMPDGY